MFVDNVRTFVRNQFNGLCKSREMKWIVYCAFFLILLVIGLYVLAWLFLFHITSDIKILISLTTELRMFIALILSGGAVTAFGVLIKYLVDDDGDGIPDFAEVPDKPVGPPRSPMPAIVSTIINNGNGGATEIKESHE